jgi:hypothetical protein
MGAADDQVLSAEVAHGDKSDAAASARDPGVAWESDLMLAHDRVRATARAWGVRQDGPEARFIAAMMDAIAVLAQVAASVKVSNEAIAKSGREAAELELARAREITKAANAAMAQARNAQLALQMEREDLVQKMIDRTMPLFVERLQGALVIRERRVNAGAQWQQFAVAGAVTLALVSGGYGLRAWQDHDAADAVARCLAASLSYNGHLYCDVTNFGTP